jgi:hypothetical protein
MKFGETLGGSSCLYVQINCCGIDSPVDYKGLNISKLVSVCAHRYRVLRSL